MRVLVTGSAGFIGCALVRRLKEKRGEEVYGVDSLVRPGVVPTGLEDEFYQADILDIYSLPLPPVDAVIHLAAQVAVTRSVSSIESDFATNALGTLRMLRWAREAGAETFIYASTNKVYGELMGVNEPIGDATPIAPMTPYGVSKATGDLYAQEFNALSGKMRCFSFRQSCIYGPTQVGSEDQGWVAYAIRCMLRGRPFYVYGDGEQVRDLLHVEDLLDLYEIAMWNDMPGGAHVVGGGAANALSVNQLMNYIGLKPSGIREWRPHDQKYFVSANDGLKKYGWEPKIGCADGIKQVTEALR